METSSLETEELLAFQCLEFTNSGPQAFYSIFYPPQS